jgi:hypothetical protein
MPGDATPPRAAAPRRGISPAIVLFFLSPMLAELLSGSSPPTEFFNPFTLVLLGLLYGGGSILVRELVLRWRKGWPSIFVLGAAYGILEEGLMVKSFFDPQWVDLGPLGVYGRWAGVNWVWSVGLTVFHAVWSIGIPILLVTLMFPQQARQPWVGRRMSRALAVLLLADVAFGYLALTPYRPPLVPYLAAGVAVVALAFLARSMPAAFRRPRPVGAAAEKPRSGRWFFLGLGWAIAFFATIWVVPNTRVVPLANIGLILLLAAATWFGLPRLFPVSAWDARHLLALASGAAAFLILLAPLQELDPARALEMKGMTVTAVVAVIGLVWMTWRTRRLERQGVFPAALGTDDAGGMTPAAT